MSENATGDIDLVDNCVRNRASIKCGCSFVCDREERLCKIGALDKFSLQEKFTFGGKQTGPIGIVEYLRSKSLALDVNMHDKCNI